MWKYIPGMVYILIEFSHNKLMSKIQPVVTRYINTIRKEKTYDVYTPYKDGKSDISK